MDTSRIIAMGVMVCAIFSVCIAGVLAVQKQGQMATGFLGVATTLVAYLLKSPLDKGQ